MSKTLIHFQEVPPDSGLKPNFLLVEGDFRRFDGIFINQCQCDENLIDELTKFLYDDEGRLKVTFQHEPAKDWDYFVHCGFFL